MERLTHGQRLRLPRQVIVVIVAVAAVLPTAAMGDGGGPTLRTEQAWFHCASDSRVATTDMWESKYPTWDTTPPTESVQDGAGCGFVDHPLYGLTPGNGEPLSGAWWTGTFAGNLDGLTIELHRLLPADGVPLTYAGGVNLRLRVEDELVASGHVSPEWTDANSGVTDSARVSVTDLGFVVEDGDGQIVRDIVVEVYSDRDYETWVFDTTEVPAGITFNPENAAAAAISAGQG